MISNSLKKLFGTRNDRELRRMGKVVKQINAFTDEIKALSNEQLAAKTAEFKQRLAGGESLDKILPEAFAVTREAGAINLMLVMLLGGLWHGAARGKNCRDAHG